MFTPLQWQEQWSELSLGRMLPGNWFEPPCMTDKSTTHVWTLLNKIHNNNKWRFCSTQKLPWSKDVSELIKIHHSVFFLVSLSPSSDYSLKPDLMKPPPTSTVRPIKVKLKSCSLGLMWPGKTLAFWNRICPEATALRHQYKINGA